MLKIANLKVFKRCRLIAPNYIRLSFYMFPIGDQSFKTELTNRDISIIKNIEVDNVHGLIDMVEYVDKGDLYSLMVEGAIKGRATGADLGIYNYKSTKVGKDFNIDLSKFIGEQFIKSIDDDKQNICYNDDEDVFANCVLAEPDMNGAEHSKVIKTFKGYLQIELAEFSFIRNNEFNSEISIVYVPQSYIQKYQLRNGDELLCTCKEDGGVMVLTSLFAINKISCINWNCNRPWFNELKSNEPQTLQCNGEFMQSIINKFDLYKGDNMFLYLNKTCQKEKVLPELIDELMHMFDYIIYLNPRYSPASYVDNCHKIIKFCTPINSKLKHQQNMVLLGANFAKRLVELGNKVAVIIDDAEVLMGIEDEADFPISKTVFSCSINGYDRYSNLFTVVSLKNRAIKDVKLNKILKSAESIAIMFDNNEIDTFNSYRV